MQEQSIIPVSTDYQKPKPTEQSIILRVVGDVDLLKAKQDKILELRSKVMVKGVHYGPPYEGSQKEVLLKPGAELIGNYFGLLPKFVERSIVERLEPSNPLIFYRYECQLFDIVTGLLVATGIGSCNSLEAKFRWRNAQRVCPDCGKETIFESKDKDKPGFFCWKKKGGCGHTFAVSDPKITGQVIGQVVNDDIFSQVNTIDKQSQKRAYIASILTGTGASYLFTQDIEDFKGHEYFGDPGRFEDEESGTPTTPPAPQKPTEPTRENGQHGLHVSPDLDGNSHTTEPSQVTWPELYAALKEANFNPYNPKQMKEVFGKPSIEGGNPGELMATFLQYQQEHHPHESPEWVKDIHLPTLWQPTLNKLDCSMDDFRSLMDFDINKAAEWISRYPDFKTAEQNVIDKICERKDKQTVF